MCSTHDRRRRKGTPIDAPIQHRRPPAPCALEGCTTRARSRGWCTTHYGQWRSGQKPYLVLRYTENSICSFEECGRKCRGLGLCAAHYRQHWAGEQLRPIRSRRFGEWRLLESGYVVRSVRRDDGSVVAVAQHREVMEKMLGRPLIEDENVHHKNGDRADNRPENLELWNTGQPAGQRIEDKIAWAKELLALYEPESLANRTTMRLAA